MVAGNGGDPKDEVQMGDTFDPYAKEIGRDNELINDNGTVGRIFKIPNLNTAPLAVAGQTSIILLPLRFRSTA